jgi:hypothetical protein
MRVPERTVACLWAQRRLPSGRLHRSCHLNQSVMFEISRSRRQTRISEDRNVQGLQGVDDVFPETILVDEVLIRIVRVVEAAVDASSHVLGEARVDETVNGIETMLGEDIDRQVFGLGVGRHIG